ncbi:hypothetical protein V1280_004761 [Bradyrhizobium sp. AZCC 2230]
MAIAIRRSRLRGGPRTTVDGGARKQSFDAKPVCDFSIVESTNGG